MRRFVFAIVILLAALVAPASTIYAEQAAKVAPTAKAGSAAKGGSAAKARATADSPVNLNSASVAQLQTLPGIGASTAQRIVEFRQKNGSFKKIEEILEYSRSDPILLVISVSRRRRTVSRSRKMSQQIYRCIANGGRTGGRTRRARGQATTGRGGHSRTVNPFMRRRGAQVGRLRDMDLISRGFKIQREVAPFRSNC